MPRKLNESVVVITGASSGIGRATALGFAREGASVVLVARNAQALREVATECEALGARALVLPADVTDEGALKEVARRTVELFGGLDVWVNNAAVTLFARFTEAPSDAFRRVIETNLFGYVHGARAAIPHFEARGGGVLINVASVTSTVGTPYLSAYTTSKWAIRGLSECLRQEGRKAGISVVTVMPASIDTPIFQHAANFTGKAIQPMSPIYRPEKVARVIVRAAKNPKREVFVGNSARNNALLRRLLPGVGELLMAKQVENSHFQDLPAAPSRGNLFTSMPPLEMSGGWRASEPGRVLRLAGVLGLLAVPLMLVGRWRGWDTKRLSKQATTALRVGAQVLPRVLPLLRVPTVRRLAMASVTR